MTSSSTEACFKAEATRCVKSDLFLVRFDCISALADGVSRLFGSMLATLEPESRLEPTEMPMSGSEEWEWENTAMEWERNRWEFQYLMTREMQITALVSRIEVGPC